MKLDKAIEILTGCYRPPNPDENPDLFDAVKLGIEALKYVDTIRQADPGHSPGFFPGETID